MKKYFIILIITLCIISCTKMDEVADSTYINVEEPYISTITDIPCASNLNKSDDYQIQATINGKNLCLNSDFHHKIFNNNWIGWRNEIWMLKKDIDSTIAIGIIYKNPAFYNHSLPYTVNRSHHDGCEVVEVTIMNYKAKYCGCTADDSQYQSLTSTQNLSVTIISFKDSVLEGTYAGDFYNRGGRIFKVTNGYFKSKLTFQNQ